MPTSMFRPGRLIDPRGCRAPAPAGSGRRYDHRRGLVERGRSAIEPLVEVELERVLLQPDAAKARAPEGVHQLAGGEVAHVRAIARAFDLLVPASRGGIRIAHLIAGDQHTAGAQPRRLRPQERDGIDDVVQHEPRHAGVEGSRGGEVGN